MQQSEQLHKDNNKLLLIKTAVAYLWFPLSILFMEFVMATSVNLPKETRHWWFVALFSAGYGMILYAMTAIAGKKKLTYILQAGLLFALSFVYMALYFVYCEFRIFYDFNTMFAGATDAATSFQGDIISMVTSTDGIWHIVLFFFPLILYLIFGWMLLKDQEQHWKDNVISVFVGALMLFVAFGASCTNEGDRILYMDDYNYNTVVGNFGVLTGLRREVWRSMTGQHEEMSFVMDTQTEVAEDSFKKTVQEETEIVKEKPEEKPVSTKSTEKKIESNEQTKKQEKQVSENKTESVLEEKAEPEKNEIDIDFEALQKQKGSQNADLDAYVASLEATNKNEYTGLFKGKNLIFMTAEAFTAEAIDQNRTPTLYRLATKGMQFTDYYQPASAGTTGGEYANLFGMLPTAGGSSVKKTQNHYNWSTLASRLTEMGYYGKAYHNNDYTYYDRDKTHINLGFSDGYEGKGNGLEEVITSQWPESDLEMLKGTLSSYIKKQPFHIYYMTVSGHSLYTFGKNAMSKKHREEVADLPYSEPVQAYLACQIELEDALTYLVGQLERLHMADDTVIVISADHFPYGLDQEGGVLTNLAELYGKKIEDSLFRDHNRLIIWSGCLEKERPIVVDEPTSSMDVLPTLCNLFGVRFDSRLLPGRDVFSEAEPLVFNLGSDWKTDKGTYIASKGKFTSASGVSAVSSEYIEQIKTIVHNKITYSKGVLNQDYFRYLFEEVKEEPADVEKEEDSDE